MVISRFTWHIVISLAAGSVSNYRTPRSSLRKLFITSGRRGYSTLVCSLYLSTHQSPVSYRCGYICLLCCSRHKQTGIGVCSNLASGRCPHGTLWQYSLHCHWCGIFSWSEKLQSISNKTWKMNELSWDNWHASDFVIPISFQFHVRVFSTWNTWEL